MIPSATCHRPSAIGYWLLPIGYLSSAIGHWLLAICPLPFAIGYWLLAIGYWLAHPDLPGFPFSS